MDLSDRLDPIQDFRGSRVLQIGVTGIQSNPPSFQINVKPIEMIKIYNLLQRVYAFIPMAVVSIGKNLQLLPLR